MSPNPIHPSSFKRSIGSRTTDLHLQIAGADDSGVFSLRSSWISRLHFRPSSDATAPAPETPNTVHPPSPDIRGRMDSNSGGGCGVGRAISTDESRTQPAAATNLESACALRRYLNLSETSREGGLDLLGSWPPPPPRVEDGGGDPDPFDVAGFGSLRVRTTYTLPLEAARNRGKHIAGGQQSFPFSSRLVRFGGEIVDKWKYANSDANYDGSRANMSPFFQLRPPGPIAIGDCLGNKGKAAVNYQESDQKSAQDRRLLITCLPSQGMIGSSQPWRRSHEQRELASSHWHANASVQHRTSNISGFNDGVNAAASSRTTSGFSAWNKNRVINYPLKRTPVCGSEPEPFSFWTMGEFNRRNIISSISPPISSSNLSRKRNANTDDNFLPSKRQEAGKS